MLRCSKQEKPATTVNMKGLKNVTRNQPLKKDGVNKKINNTSKI